MIVEKLTDEDFDRFLGMYIWPDRAVKVIGSKLKLSDARSIRRVEDKEYVVINFGCYGTFYFHDFDFYNCYYDSEYYNMYAYRTQNNLHDKKWVEFISNHPIHGEQWNKLYNERLEKENAKKQEDALTR
ncbi:MAG: hypothetical protein IJ458_01895 [Clostridia bacterium]|nr:hypothetical protein [Clostridia bacterium]MBQ8522398.1 hypothetical protein [Clostridia bacterium]